jgi:hypothetical protein
MLEKYIDKLVPIITTIVWVGGMGYIIMNLYTCFNEDEVQEVIIPKTIDEKIDSVKTEIYRAKSMKIDFEFSLDSMMAVIPKKIAMYDKLIELDKKPSDTTKHFYQSFKHMDSLANISTINREIEYITFMDSMIVAHQKSLDSLIRLKEDK